MKINIYRKEEFNKRIYMKIENPNDYYRNNKINYKAKNGIMIHSDVEPQLITNIIYIIGSDYFKDTDEVYYDFLTRYDRDNYYFLYKEALKDWYEYQISAINRKIYVV